MGDLLGRVRRLERDAPQTVAVRVEFDPHEGPCATDCHDWGFVLRPDGTRDGVDACVGQRHGKPTGVPCSCALCEHEHGGR